MTRIYKGYTIEKITAKDFIITKDGELAEINGRWMKNSNGVYARNAKTLKEAKERIDNIIG